MQSYIREHTVGSLVRATFGIYFKHFFSFLIVYLVPVTPFVLIQAIAVNWNEPVLSFLLLVLSTIAGLFATAMITLLISDICLGNKTSLPRYFRRVFGVLVPKLFATSLLQILALWVGLILLIVPGLIAMVWLMFATSIVVLEGTWGVAALKRSKALGDTKHWRNFGVLVIFMIIGFVVGSVLGGLAGYAFAGSGNPLILNAFIAILQQVFAPVSFVAIVLLYYDLRVRKEAYDMEALAEDLKY